MLLTPHILTGLLFAGRSPSPVLVPVLSILSFFFLEMIPHWDPEGNVSKKLQILRYVDYVVGILSFLIIVFFKKLDFNYVLGGISTFCIYFFFHILHSTNSQQPFLQKLLNWRKKLKYHDRSVWGILIQISVCVLALTLIFNLIDFPTWDRIQRNILVNIFRIGY